jgi:hypothetical protein
MHTQKLGFLFYDIWTQSPHYIPQIFEKQELTRIKFMLDVQLNTKPQNLVNKRLTTSKFSKFNLHELVTMFSNLKVLKGSIKHIKIISFFTIFMRLWQYIALALYKLNSFREW